MPARIFKQQEMTLSIVVGFTLQLHAVFPLRHPFAEAFGFHRVFGMGHGSVKFQQRKKQHAGNRSILRVLDTALKLVHRVQHGDKFFA